MKSDATLTDSGFLAETFYIFQSYYCQWQSSSRHGNSSIHHGPDKSVGRQVAEATCITLASVQLAIGLCMSSEFPFWVCWHASSCYNLAPQPPTASLNILEQDGIIPTCRSGRRISTLIGKENKALVGKQLAMSERWPVLRSQRHHGAITGPTTSRRYGLGHSVNRKIARNFPKISPDGG